MYWTQGQTHTQALHWDPLEQVSLAARDESGSVVACDSARNLLNAGIPKIYL